MFGLANEFVRLIQLSETTPSLLSKVCLIGQETANWSGEILEHKL